MLNFVPKRIPAVSLLFGKRNIQRVKIGTNEKVVEIPTALISKIYEKTDSNVNLHNGDYNPLKWKDYMGLRVDSFHLIQIAQMGDAAPKTSLSKLKIFGRLSDLVSAQKALTEIESVNVLMEAPRFKYPKQG